MPSVPSSQSRWSDVLTHSIPTWANYPKRFLSTEELEFGLWLQSYRVQGYYELLTAEVLVSKVKELWSDLLRNISLSTLTKHLVRLTPSSSRHNKSYLNREYRLPNGRKFGLWLFRKGIIRGYSVSVRGARYRVLYGYPVEYYSLVMKNYVSGYPPHDYFASQCTTALQDGIGSNVLRKVNPDRYRVPHWEGDKDYVVDNCYAFQSNGREQYLWQEVHTGSEGYNEHIFLKRIITMENFLTTTGRGYFVVFVPFVRDFTERVAPALERLKALAPDIVPLRRCFVVPYTHIDLFKERLGFYHHRNW